MSMFYVDLENIQPYLRNPAFRCTPLRERGETKCYVVVHTPIAPQRRTFGGLIANNAAR